jgi:hypothetical protein
MAPRYASQALPPLLDDAIDLDVAPGGSARIPLRTPAGEERGTLVTWEQWATERRAVCALFDHLPAIHKRIRVAQRVLDQARMRCRTCRLRQEPWQRAVATLALWRFEGAVMRLVLGKFATPGVLSDTLGPAPRQPAQWCVEHARRKAHVQGELAAQCMAPLDGAYGAAVVAFPPGGVLVHPQKRLAQRWLSIQIRGSLGLDLSELPR